MWRDWLASLDLGFYQERDIFFMHPKRREKNEILGVLVMPHCKPLVAVAALGHVHDGKQILQRVFASEGISHHCLFPVCQGVRTDALSFFYYFCGLLEDLLLQAQMSDFPSEFICLTPQRTDVLCVYWSFGTS